MMGALLVLAYVATVAGFAYHGARKREAARRRAYYMDALRTGQTRRLYKTGGRL